MSRRMLTWFAIAVAMTAMVAGAAFAGQKTPRTSQAVLKRSPVQLLAQPPVLSPAELEAREDALEQLYEIRQKIEQVAPAPSAAPLLIPRNPASSPIPQMRAPAAPGTFTLYRNTVMTDVFTNNSTSSTNEPSVGMGCNNVLYSGNWYASLSTDYGETFSFIDPDAYFPAFCCDQVVYWDDSRALMFWYLQASFSFSGNTVRLAVTDNPAGITGSLANYDITPQDLGYTSDVNFDYPDLATSNNYLYVMTNAFSITLADTEFVAGIIMRFHLDDLANLVSPIGFDWFEDEFGTIRPAQGGTGTMYFGSHPDLATVRIFSWAEGPGAIPFTDEGVDLFYQGHSAPSPDGNDFMAFSDTRTLAGFVANGQVGFMWNSAQGGPYSWPNVRWARFDQGSLSLDDQGAIWSADVAWGYPSVHPNSDGEYGGTISWGGGDYYPSLAAWIADSFNGRTISPLENAFVAGGTDGPSRNRWGDYNTTRQNDPFGDTWVGTGFVLNGGNTNTDAEPHMVWFGREEDTPDLAPDITCPSDITVECSATNGTPKDDPQLAAFFAGVSASAVCGDVTVTNDAPDLFPHGQTTTVTFTATDDGGETSTCTADVTVEDTTPPVVVCPDDIVVECSDHCGTPADDPQLVAFFAGFSADDVCDPNPEIGNDAPECFPHVPGDGETVVTFTATDHDDNAASCTATVKVVDTTPPEITVELNRDVLWPPNHKLAQVCATVTVTDICDPEPTFVLSSITSDEDDNDHGDGNTVNDIQNEDIGTPDLCYDLRSERQGMGDGRVYTIIYCASDHDGNTACDTVEVRVPHDQSAGAAASIGYIADGKGFTPGADQFAVIIPSAGKLDAASIPRSELYIGNTAGVARPLSLRVVELNSDGRPDLAVFFSTQDAMRIMGTSLEPEDLGGSGLDPLGGKPKRDDGPLGLHFATRADVDFLVTDLLVLGAPVAMPAIWLEEPPMPFGDPDDEDPVVTRSMGMTSIHPNPFNPQVTIDFAVQSSGLVRIAIYDVRGSLVRRVTDEVLPAGEHSVTWNGVDERGGRAASGIYFVRMIAGSYSETKKIVMLK